jgi:hypothetical protein
VHPDMALEELGDGLALRDPERDVIESFRLHEIAKDIDAPVAAET